MRSDLWSAVSRRGFLQTSGELLTATMLAGTARSLFAQAGTSAPPADSKLIYRTITPPNAEPPLDKLVSSWITPADLFFIRSHAATPKIDLSGYKLKVEGMVEKPVELTLAELRDKFQSKTTIATLTCAGNRRNEHSQVKPVGGVQWEAGAVGNAAWTGIRLSDLLKHVGVRPEAKHVWFEGLDEITEKGKTFPFGGSIPLEKAMEDTDDAPGCLLAHAMNENPLPPDHGYPLRAVVPGYIGARSVKWLGRIRLDAHPSPNHYLTHAYKLVEQDAELAWAEAGPIYRYPMNAAIAQPVQVSADGGRTWTNARLDPKPQPYTWALWSTVVAVTPKTKQIVARAHDSAGEVQPQSVDWNVKGYLYNAWFKQPVQVAAKP
jgi:sulfite oxidase